MRAARLAAITWAVAGLCLASTGGCRDKGGGSDDDRGDDSGEPEGPPPPPPGFIEDGLNFGSLRLTKERTRRARFRNPGAEDLQIDEFRIASGEPYRVTDRGTCRAGRDLDPGDTCEIEVAFAAPSIGPFEGILELDFTDIDGSETRALPLAGVGELMCVDPPETLGDSTRISDPGPLVQSVEERRADYEARLRALVPVLNGWFPEIPLDPERVLVYDGPGEDWGEDVDIKTALIDIDPRRILGLAMEVEQGSDGRWHESASGTDCALHFPAAGLFLAGSNEQESLLAHELFHCYQFTLHDRDLSDVMSDWLIEGAASWVGERHATGSSELYPQAQRYMTERTRLFDRSYDAYPFFEHLYRYEEMAYDRLIAASREGEDEGAFHELTARVADDDLVETWPTGLWLDDGRGYDWNTSVPGFPPLPNHPRREIPEDEVAAGVLIDVPSFTPTHATVTFPADEFYRITTVGTHGRLHGQTVEGETLEREMDGGVRSWLVCAGIECTCDGGGRPPLEFEEIRPDLDIAAVGRDAEGFVRIEPTNPGCCEGGEIDPRLVGTWTFVNQTARNLATTPLLRSGTTPCPGEQNTDPVCTNGLDGTHSLRIDSDGMLTKTYTGFHKFGHCRHSEVLRSMTDRYMSGTVHACLSVNRIWTPEHGYEIAEVELSDIVDLTSTQVLVNGDLVPPTEGLDGELIFMRTGPALNGENQLGAYLFDGDDIIDGRSPHTAGDVCDPHRRFVR